MSAFDLRGGARALRRAVESVDRIWVTVHESPDGDSIGAALALQSVFTQLGKQAVAIRQLPFPAQYERLPGAAAMVPADGLDRTFAPEMIVAVDIGSFARIGPVLDWITPETWVVNIDHHPDNPGPGKPCQFLDLVDATAASTTMLTYLLIAEEWPRLVGAAEATCLYLGLVTDTGCFRHSNTNAAALRVATELATRGADAGHLAEEFMFRRRPQAIQLLGEVLSSLRFENQGRFASMVLSLDMMQRTGARHDETEGFVNYASSIEGVHAAVLLREIDARTTKASLRSSGALDVSRVAAEFGGGGHRNAAGCTLALDLATACAAVTAAALRHLAATPVAEESRRA